MSWTWDMTPTEGLWMVYALGGVYVVDYYADGLLGSPPDMMEAGLALVLVGVLYVLGSLQTIRKEVNSDD